MNICFQAVRVVLTVLASLSPGKYDKLGVYFGSVYLPD